MAPFTKGKRKDEEEIYVNAQQISKGEFWQIPLPFTDFLVSVILLGSSSLPVSLLFQHFSLPSLQVSVSGLLEVLGNPTSILTPYPTFFDCYSSLPIPASYFQPAGSCLPLSATGFLFPSSVHFRVQFLTLHFRSHASGVGLLVFMSWSSTSGLLLIF